MGVVLAFGGDVGVCRCLWGISRLWGVCMEAPGGTVCSLLYRGRWCRALLSFPGPESGPGPAWWSAPLCTPVVLSSASLGTDRLVCIQESERWLFSGPGLAVERRLCLLVWGACPPHTHTHTLPSSGGLGRHDGGWMFSAFT